jgi:predicted ATPase
METFSSIELKLWRQFETIDINLDNQLCVLTGPNGCGKTTILNVLGRHFGWNIHFVNTPYLSSRQEKKFWSDVQFQRQLEFEQSADSVPVGMIRYSSGHENGLLAPASSSSGQYHLKYSNMQPVEGIHIPSHRPVTSYVPIENIPVNPKTSQQHFDEYRQLQFQTYGSASAKNPGTVLKQSLIALGVFGYGYGAVRPNLEYQRLFEEFQNALRGMLPREIGFQRLEVRVPEIILVTSSGDFSLDAMSGGVSAIFGMAWQMLMYGVDKPACTVIIDEPENHLHPSMQRSFLPSLTVAFPRYRFIVATHSPFIVSSSPDAWVYALTFNDRKRIVSTRLDEVDLAGSPNTILRDILDVPSTIPLWVERRVKEVIEKHERRGVTDTTAEEVYTELKQLGLERAIGNFSKRRGDA